ncbi:hypothetical protein LINGRAHAP2_LOCUS32344 [Linum grandiflorum]
MVSKDGRIHGRMRRAATRAMSFEFSRKVWS